MKFRCILYTQNGYNEKTALPMGWTCAHAFQWVGCAPKDEWDHLSALGYYPPVAFPGCVCGGPLWPGPVHSAQHAEEDWQSQIPQHGCIYTSIQLKMT